MQTTTAIVFERPEQLALRQLELTRPGEDDVLVDVEWSGVSSGTERLLWNGRMPPFPGLGYPLVPGYESVGRIREAGPGHRRRIGERVFLAGSCSFRHARCLFGGAAAELVVPAEKALPVSEGLGEQASLLALAATARHALRPPGGAVSPSPEVEALLPELIIGHGVLGRLLARLIPLCGGRPPVVWERRPERRRGDYPYRVLAPEDDPRRDYRSVIDASGDASILDPLIARLATGGEIVLAGFYPEPLVFAFPPAFVRETRIRVAAEWQPQDMADVGELLADGSLELSGLISHRAAVEDAEAAYRTAFTDERCLKMILDWRADP